MFLALAGEWAGGEPQALVTESLSIVIRREDFRIRESNHNELGAVKALTPLRATEAIKSAAGNGAFLPFLPRLPGAVGIEPKFFSLPPMLLTDGRISVPVLSRGFNGVCRTNVF